MLRSLGLGLVLVGLVAGLRARDGSREVGAGDWRAALAKRNRKAARRERKRGESRARGRAAGGSCCDAASDSWRESRSEYAAWRAPDPVGFHEAYRQCFRESQDAAAMGDYSKPASRRCVLGKMHAAKLAAWEVCRAECRGGRQEGADELVSFVGGDGVRWWMRAGAWIQAGVRESNLGIEVLSWTGKRGDPVRVVDFVDSLEEGDERARELLQDD